MLDELGNPNYLNKSASTKRRKKCNHQKNSGTGASQKIAGEIDQEELEAYEELGINLNDSIIAPPTDAKLDILEQLVSPIRDDKEFGKMLFSFSLKLLENWTLKEIAIFECSLCVFGKRYDIVQKMVSVTPKTLAVLQNSNSPQVYTKSINEITRFYVSWKRTSHYRIWHQHRQQLKLANHTTY